MCVCVCVCVSEREREREMCVVVSSCLLMAFFGCFQDGKKGKKLRKVVERIIKKITL